ncbi:MAG: hypothetical protein GWM87_10985 [Xanthomonadales bacterium]|nr:hypothetical protein [Xanthomonadales bacterium]NIX13402.1 hypothetical protein [Xanthomonadales bacterium]
MSYLRVEDVDALASRATEPGGQVREEPFDRVNVGGFRTFSDPAGGHIAMYQPASDG